MDSASKTALMNPDSNHPKVIPTIALEAGDRNLELAIIKAAKNAIANTIIVIMAR
ncbi:hypothetical protein D3C74_490620 [compost metagenome]